MRKALAILGTASSVGKTTITTALCRHFTNQGLDTAPFKAFNLSSESFTHDNLTVGYAQYLQALACKTPYQAQMNPLFKKYAHDKFECYLNGKKHKPLTIAENKSIVNKAFTELQAQSELIIVEGSGSFLELNIMHLDLANTHFALQHNIPVIIVADISHGGIFGNVFGHLQLLEPEVRKLVKGIIINKFAGDPKTFIEGVQIIEELTNVKVLGVIPELRFSLPQEDSYKGQTQILDYFEIEKTITNLTTEITKYLDFEYLEALLDIQKTP